MISKEEYQKLINACEYGGIGMDTIILLHNAAAVMEEIGTKYNIQSCLEYAEALKIKGQLEYRALIPITKL